MKKGNSASPTGRIVSTKAEAAAELAERRFPPPWSVEEQAACFTVRDPDFASYFVLF